MARTSNLSAIGTHVAAVGCERVDAKTPPICGQSSLRWRGFAGECGLMRARESRGERYWEIRRAGSSVRKQRRRVYVVSTVLVVDDDLGLRETLRSLLELEGYEVALAGDGLDALRALEGVAPDAILLDLMMPRMNGEEFVQELSRRGRRAEFPIIILSADMRARQTADQLGARACVPKPFNVDDLLSQLERAVAH